MGCGRPPFFRDLGLELHYFQNRTSCAIDEDPGFSVVLTILCYLVEEVFSGQSLSLQEYELLEAGMAMTGGLPQIPEQRQADYVLRE